MDQLNNLIEEVNYYSPVAEKPRGKPKVSKLVFFGTASTDFHNSMECWTRSREQSPRWQMRLGSGQSMKDSIGPSFSRPPKIPLYDSAIQVP